MKVTVVSGKREPKREVVELPEHATVAHLKAAYKPRMDIHRKSFKLAAEGDDGKATALTNDAATLLELGVTADREVQFKDLGPQVGYRTVFVVEYAGPIAFMLLYALRPDFIYGAGASKMPLNDTQKLYVGAFIAHFVKRELETFFVHKFSRPTMPLRNIFKNCSYYWSFAAFMGYFLCHPEYTAPASALQSKLAAVGMLVMELGNLAVHLRLAGMRKAEGDQRRDAPKGGLFALVSCPNYTFEVMSWVFYSIGSSVLMSWAFTGVGFLQMSEWALKKHKGYVKAEPQLKSRKAIVPFLL
eukprot:CAMPEP_0174841256 /NCGR_PEP_ID=MMETSP1114-20130205/9192_1 /TAXON_ID=312471 /ORGANISM="Neobodo designis, Strain CCAP 1951/1" /LENGTH=299 /DNA_ID=CAMNT_0016075437 /DNA_START=48 /DNA_END=947 /DNA_ORIENTATION=+